MMSRTSLAGDEVLTTAEHRWAPTDASCNSLGRGLAEEIRAVPVKQVRVEGFKVSVEMDSGETYPFRTHPEAAQLFAAAVGDDLDEAYEAWVSAARVALSIAEDHK